MGSIKLTPFVLFLILLLVLVIAMIFGYKTNMVVEGATSSPYIWSSASEVSGGYYSTNQLQVVYTSNDTKILFDVSNGNIVIPKATGYSLITRDSDGTEQDVTTSSPATSTATSASPATSSTPWSVHSSTNGLDILYSPLGTSTIVIIIDPIANTILAVFRNTPSGAKVVTLSTQNATGLTTNTANPSSYTTPSTNTFKSITLNGDATTALEIVPDVFYEKTAGLCVTTSDGYDTSIDFKTGLSKQVTKGNVLVITTMVADMIVVNIITKSSSLRIMYYRHQLNYLAKH